jgi:hypothetical protein
MKKIAAILILAFLVILACDPNTFNPPETVAPIKISSPTNGSTLHDRQLIRAIAGDGYSFVRVEFIIDGDTVYSDSTSPFQYEWNIFRYESGTNHSLLVSGYTVDTTYTSELVSVQISYTAGLTYISSYSSLSQQASGVTNYGNALFVSNGISGLELLDITNLASPVFRSRFSASGYALHSDIDYPYVYIADRDQKVSKADFSDPDTMLSMFTYSSQSQVSDVAVSDNYLFVAESDKLTVLRLFNLTFYSSLSFSDHLNFVVARHDTAFVVGNNSFSIVNCGNPNTLELVGSYNSLSLGQGVAVLDTFAFVASSGAGVIEFSIDNPANPRELTRFNPGQSIVTVDVGNGTLFAGATTGQIFALDYHTAGTISLLDQFNSGNQIKEIDYNDYYLYVAATSNVDIMRYISAR